MAAVILAALAGLSALAAILSKAKGSRRSFLISKPLTTVLIIAAGFAATPFSAVYKTFILAGLGCSLAGDIFLMFPEKWFRAGLVSFLAAHIFYILAFRPGPGEPVSTAVLLPFVIYGLLVFLTLAPSVGALKLPILFYTGAITVMAWLAANRFIELGGRKSLLAFSGAILFLVSDSVLAYDRFGRKFAPAQVIVLATYFPAQILIALSI
jgi:uncharacterized membrane protein YhhN